MDDDAEEPRRYASPIAYAGELAPRGQRSFLDGVLSCLRIVEHRAGKAVTGVRKWKDQVLEVLLAPDEGWAQRIRVEYVLHRFTYSCRRSEEHTSELQSHLNLVCRLLLEKKKNKKIS